MLDLPTPRAFRALIPPARYKGAHGGRGSGKSHFFAELLVERAYCEDGLRAVCIRENQKSLQQSVKRLIEDKIQTMGLGAAFRVMEAEIRTPGDGLIIFQGMQNHTAESIKSLEGYDVAWVEEAQALSVRSLDMLRPTLRKDSSELWFSWNPRQEKDPVDDLLRCNSAAARLANSKPPPGAVVVEANWQHNPLFPNVLREEMEYDRRRDPEKYQHVWLGGYQRNSEARVFKNWKVEAFETPADARFYLGGDWGFGDPTVLVRGFIGRWSDDRRAISDPTGRTLFVDHEAYKVNCEIDHTPALFDTVPESRRWPIIADSGRPDTISYMQRHGFGNISGAVKGARSVEEGVEFLKAYDIVVHPRCRHAADELALYSYKADPKTNEILPELEDKENHVIDSLRYAVEALRRSTYDSTFSWV